MTSDSQPVDSSAPADPAVRQRSRRVLLLLAMIWMLNGFDLTFTIMANDHTHFNEMNPIARAMLDHPYAIYAFKLGLVAFASVVLFSFRDRPVVELGTWLVLAIYVALSFTWLDYFHRAAGHLY